ncbi:MAG: hypothetical protein M3Q07_22280 [Pseudobdellovibrionaceae bacterium]|nr:hypothetical protein [Pseudobdellovibrionaceae bacterium]
MLTIDVDDNASENWSAKSMIEECRRITAALNVTAEKAAADIKADMPQRFTLRNSWVHKGIRFDRANTKNMEARVYSIDPYMNKQEDGQTYKPDGHVAIPSEVRPTKSSPIPRGKLPNALRGRDDIFKFDFSQKSSYKPYPLVGIFQRTHHGKFFRVLYLLKDRKNTKPLWNFRGQVERAMDRHFDRAYGEVDEGHYFKPGYDPRGGYTGSYIDDDRF